MDSAEAAALHLEPPWIHEIVFAIDTRGDILAPATDGKRIWFEETGELSVAPAVLDAVARFFARYPDAMAPTLRADPRLFGPDLIAARSALQPIRGLWPWRRS
jgi:hypothetical protein